MQRRDFMKIGAGSLGALALGRPAAAAQSDGPGAASSVPMPPIYAERGELEKAYAEHVGFGHLDALERSGLEIVIGEREGPRVRDAYTGKWYWDCHRVGSVHNLGHRHPRVVGAMRQALEQLEIGNSHLLAQYKAWAAEKLALSTGGQLPGIIWTASGTEANEVAFKASRGITGRRKVVSLENSYHGHSGLTIAAGGNAAHRKLYGMEYPEEFVHVPWNDSAAMENAVDDRTAAVLLEPMPARMGFPPPQPGYLKKVQELCRERGALLVMDEVIVGVGGTGTFWLYQQEDIVPDILTTAKGLGGGVGASAAALVTEEVYRWLGDSYLAHYTTFGGHELACVAAATTCEVILEPGFLEHVRALARRFAEGFADSPFRLSHRGLCMGLLLPDPDNATMIRKLFANGLIASGGLAGVVQLRVPLILSFEEADQIISIVDRVARESFA